MAYSEFSRGTSSERQLRVFRPHVLRVDSFSRQWSEFGWIRLVQGSVAGTYGYDNEPLEEFGDGLSDHQLLNKNSATWCSNKMPLYDVILPVRSTELQCLTAYVTVAKRLAVSDSMALLWSSG